MLTIIELTANEAGVAPQQALAVKKLLDDGCTVPFIARYRKEAHGNLDEVQIGKIQDRLGYYTELEERKATVLKSIDEQPLHFEVLEYQVIVHHAIGSFRLPLYQNVSEFFDFKAPTPYVEADDGYQLEYEAPCLKSILGRCNFAMAQDELRPVLNGVYFNLTDKFCDYVSSDGHKLVRVRIF